MNMTMKKTKQVHCAHCGTKFTKSLVSIENDKKLGRQPFCSISCINDYNIALVETIEKELKSFKHILSLVDENPQNVKTSSDIDILYLKTIWDNQSGKCIYSGVLLVLPVLDSESQDILYLAAIDRINPSVGYTKGNILFISKAMSEVKKTLSHDKALKLVQLIRSN